MSTPSENWFCFGLVGFLVLFYALAAFRIGLTYKHTQKWPFGGPIYSDTEKRARLLLVLGYLFFHLFILSYMALPQMLFLIFKTVFPLHWFWLRASGLLLGWGGAVLWFYLALQMGHAWRIGIDPQSPPSALVKTGFYRYFRHPIYLTLDGMTLGAFFIIPIWPFFLCMIICVYGWYLQGKSEEHFLSTHFGKQYSISELDPSIDKEC